MSLHYHPLAHIHPPFKRERGCHILIRGAPISFFQTSVMTSFNVFQPLMILLHSTRMTLFIFCLWWDLKETIEKWGFHNGKRLSSDFTHRYEYKWTDFRPLQIKQTMQLLFGWLWMGFFFLGGFWKSSVCSYLGKKSSPTINYDYQ